LLTLGSSAIRVLFEGGEFDTESVSLTYYALQFFTIVLISQSLLDIVVRAYAATKDTLTPLVISIFTTTINFVLAIWLTRPFVDGGLEHGGPPLANGIAVGLEVTIGLSILHYRWKGFNFSQIISYAGKAALAAGMMAITVIWLKSILPDSPLVLLLIGGFTGSVVYLATAYWLGIREVLAFPYAVMQALFRRVTSPRGDSVG